MRGMVLAAVVGGLFGHGVFGAEELVETAGAWLVTCHQTEAGGRQCDVRNDEDGKPALEQDALLSLTLHDGRNEVEGLVRIADLDLPPRLEVEVTFGDETMTLEGVGRRGRLAARFALPRQELARFADADVIQVRLVDKSGEMHAVSFGSDGLQETLAIAQDQLSR